MDFKETYKKYLDGTATDDEKAFVEAEIERARVINAEILAQAKVAEQPDDAAIKAKKKKRLKQTIKTIIISTIVFLVIALIAFGTVFGISVSSAIDNLKVEPVEAKEKALEFAYIYARDHYSYAGSMETIASESGEMNIRELVFNIPLSKCHYVYEFEFIVADMEMDIEVNARTGMCTIKDIDRVD